MLVHQAPSYLPWFAVLVAQLGYLCFGRSVDSAATALQFCEVHEWMRLLGPTLGEGCMMNRRRDRRSLLGPAGLAVIGLLLTPALAYAGVPHDRVVSADPVDHTPQLVKTDGVPRPHVDAIALSGNAVYAGGLFDTVSKDGASLSRVNVVAFDGATGAVSTTFMPRIEGGQVWALAADPVTNSVYVGGAFKTVDGVKRAGLAKLDAATGARDTLFKPPFTNGQVKDLEIATIAGKKRLIVGANAGKRLMSLDPATGAHDGYLDAAITEAIPGAWGKVGIYQIAIDPSATHLVATGNFLKVDGISRRGFLMLDLNATGDSLSTWYYPGFSKQCTSTHPRRIAYLQGVDWSPDGSAFNITATGQITKSKDDIWYHRLGDQNKPNTTVCDAIGRFSLADPAKPDWINYTGGDSVWSVSDTGSAVYTAGHFKWLDNPDGYASLGIGDKTSGAPAVSRRGIGAIDPATGLANSWNPGLVGTRIGGKAFLADSGGLWVGNDATRFDGELHLGLAYAPR